ncbi:hypothetical protein BDK51DRAFT_45213 [Blyttiomyces helicus]|uniref:Uncharacterized protein n=1 Tax=Blyttiomyces helicus TaxID=388810 RepID=A0A4P9W279_9FUNG|nr:hypothetical protein BDK51DRAFT_45213 [Blyttiomyces helicus]|eukprot:RKO84176.1 hypothetical protein BDK51DRAFT_45213 [Blyttiomyces helicus]
MLRDPGACSNIINRREERTIGPGGRSAMHRWMHRGCDPHISRHTGLEGLSGEAVIRGMWILQWERNRARPIIRGAGLVPKLPPILHYLERPPQDPSSISRFSGNPTVVNSIAAPPTLAKHHPIRVLTRLETPPLCATTPTASTSAGPWTCGTGSPIRITWSVRRSKMHTTNARCHGETHPTGSHNKKACWAGPHEESKMQQRGLGTQREWSDGRPPGSSTVLDRAMGAETASHMCSVDHCPMPEAQSLTFSHSPPASPAQMAPVGSAVDLPQDSADIPPSV